MRPYLMDGESAAHGAPDHASDADLLRILDREATLSPLHDTTAHVSTCAECATRFDLLRERRLRLQRMLVDTDVAAPPAPGVGELLARVRERQRKRHRPALRAAALLLVAGTLAAAQPAVRRWMAAQWDRATGAEQTSTPASSVSPTVRSQSPARGSVLSFDAGAGPLVIRFDTRPSAGALTVAGDSGALVRVEQVGGTNVELLVSRQELHVRNAAGTAASFVVHVPRTIGRVELKFGSGPSRDDIRIDLAREPRRIVTFNSP
jgi:hypothetical protein